MLDLDRMKFEEKKVGRVALEKERKRPFLLNQV